MWNKIKNLFKSSTETYTVKQELTSAPAPITAIIVFSPEEAEKLGRQIPNSVIVGKVRNELRKNSGLAKEVVNILK